MRRFEFVHVDVFADKQLEGNGLAVVFCDRFFEDSVLLNLAREFKQFETIFLSGFDGDSVNARVFTVDGELPFAGHPALGAAAALHDRYAGDTDTFPVLLRLPQKDVPVVCEKAGHGFHARMAQGKPSFLGRVPEDELPWLMAAHGLSMDDLDKRLPVEVVSTGLPYVLIPVTGGLDRARVTVRDLEQRIAAWGASYTYLFDTSALEARTWDNLGLVEDSATGSAAGPVCAYLCRHGMIAQGDAITISQGRYANRPGKLRAWMENGEVFVSGDVVFFSRGEFTLGV